jgi:hypothetical protein
MSTHTHTYREARVEADTASSAHERVRRALRIASVAAVQHEQLRLIRAHHASMHRRSRVTPTGGPSVAFGPLSAASMLRYDAPTRRRCRVAISLLRESLPIVVVLRTTTHHQHTHARCLCVPVRRVILGLRHDGAAVGRVLDHHRARRRRAAYRRRLHTSRDVTHANMRHSSPTCAARSVSCASHLRNASISSFSCTESS